MKKLLIILIALVAMSCEKSWYKQGHIDPGNTCEFIVNDSISVVGGNYYDDPKLLYKVAVNGEIAEVTPSFHSSSHSIEDVVNTMEWRYKARNDTVILPPKKPKKLAEECFKF